MTDNTRRNRQTGGLIDIPLPGSFDVLTLQANVTLYPRAQTGKFVVVLRDPLTQVEIGRLGSLEEPLRDLLPVLDVQFGRVVRQGLYMGGLDYQYRNEGPTAPI